MYSLVVLLEGASHIKEGRESAQHKVYVLCNNLWANKVI